MPELNLKCIIWTTNDSKMKFNELKQDLSKIIFF